MDDHEPGLSQHISNSAKTIIHMAAAQIASSKCVLCAVLCCVCMYLTQKMFMSSISFIQLRASENHDPFSFSHQYIFGGSEIVQFWPICSGNEYPNMFDMFVVEAPKR